MREDAHAIAVAQRQQKQQQLQQQAEISKLDHQLRQAQAQGLLLEDRLAAQAEEKRLLLKDKLAAQAEMQAVLLRETQMAAEAAQLLKAEQAKRYDLEKQVSAVLLRETQMAAEAAQQLKTEQAKRYDLEKQVSAQSSELAHMAELKANFTRQALELIESKANEQQLSTQLTALHEDTHILDINVRTLPPTVCLMHIAPFSICLSSRKLTLLFRFLFLLLHLQALYIAAVLLFLMVLREWAPISIDSLRCFIHQYVMHAAPSGTTNGDNNARNPTTTTSTFIAPAPMTTPSRGGATTSTFTVIMPPTTTTTQRPTTRCPGGKKMVGAGSGNDCWAWLSWPRKRSTGPPSTFN